jgi:hypothetical protein
MQEYTVDRQYESHRSMEEVRLANVMELESIAIK